ncbi:DNA polymerase III subunit alpha [Xylophilus rhododendri]|uniref:Error-prone DNA polymerase n=1 Tax=Xylophilus rhododendri TaxID=2697032 RepID=A0A857J048_9BURK|nr:error-prone DNA polymerase [Xylophilus rhododendri]QHI96569.1 DNA polymerase III subunit alpha [Xylophilus rhododendri]
MPEREISLQGRPASVLRFPAPLRAAAPVEVQVSDTAGEGGYTELHCISNFSFHRGASHPDELVVQALKLGYRGIAITDECSVAGVVRAWDGLKQHHVHEADLWRKKHPDAEGDPPEPATLQLLYGSEFLLEDGARLVAIARDLAGWGGLCQAITDARRATTKGEYDVGAIDFALLAGCERIYLPHRPPGQPVEEAALQARVQQARDRFGAQGLWLGVQLLCDIDDDLWLELLTQAGGEAGLPLLACGDVHMHEPKRKRLQDVLTAVRQGRALGDCGFALQRNAQRYLRPVERLRSLYPAELLQATQQLAARCSFRMEDIAYHYPKETIPPGLTPAQALRQLVEQGVQKRYPQGPRAADLKQIEDELGLIAFKKYEMYFLTVEDIVRQARKLGILCQGRGSAANSVVCYCLGITEVRPEDSNLLFERFISKERDEPPDIDVDFEHQRREEVIQYIYKKYGRERAAIAAVVVRYRSRMAIRDVGAALGVPEGLVDTFAKDHYWFDKDILKKQIQESQERSGVSAPQALIEQWLELAYELRDFPRHLSQHVGGFVLTDGPLTRLVPVEPASMEKRSVIQWEKRDLEAVGLMKVDVLALGMLSALRRMLDFRNRWRGTPWTLQSIPRDQEAVFDMICTADTIGVFQVESRAQMSMLPRLLPREFYDLVVEVAIVRPGPIQGKMVHPYLKARQTKREGKPIVYAKNELERSLKRTLGVPIFQEQVMQLAMDAAGFTADRADRLRRSMAGWGRKGGVQDFQDELVKGMTSRGYADDFANGVFEQIKGFGEYGFPESHAASFALLVYLSCWIKCFEPAAFLAGILDAQPMGFYSVSQLVQDARRHAVEVRPVDVTVSGIDSLLEPAMPPRERLYSGIEWARHPRPKPDNGMPSIPAPGEPVWPGTRVPQPGRLAQPAVRLSLRLVGGLSAEAMKRIVKARTQAAFTSVEDLALRAELDTRDMQALAAADALGSLAGNRRQQMWEASAQKRAPALLRGVPVHEAALVLPAPGEHEDIVGDYASTGLTLRRHPLALLRPRLARWRLLSAQALRDLPHGTPVRGCGIVTMRQRPPTAKGTLFVTLEDETGIVNVIVWADQVEKYREALLKSRLLAVEGIWQRDSDSGGQVRHLLGRKFTDVSAWLGRLGSNKSRDFH